MKRIEGRTNQAMRRSTRSVRSLDAQMKAAAVTAQRFMAMFGVTIGVAGITRLIGQLDELGKQALRTGVDVESLQAIIHSATLAGASDTDMQRGLQRLNEEIAKASQGTTELGRLLEANGVSIRDANGDLRSTKDLFFEIADLVANAKSQQEGALIAQIAMGRSARDLLPLLQQGAAALREGEQAARDSGVVISQEIIDAAQRFNDAWTIAWAQFRAHAVTAVAAVGGPLASLVNDAANFVRMLNAIKTGDVERAMELFADRFGTPLELTVTEPRGTGDGSTVVPQRGGAGGGGRGGATSAIDRQQEAVRRLISDLEHERRVIGMSEAQRRVENTLRQAGAAATDEQRAKIEGLVREIQAAEDAAQAAERQMQFFGFAALNAIDGLIFRGDKASDVIRNLTRMLAQAALQAALLDSGPLAGLFGSGGLFGSFAGGFASGGRIPAGQFGLVGERGPEFVRGPAMVTPMSGGGVQVNVVNQSGGEVTERRRRGSGGREIVDIVIGAVEDGMARGRFDQSLGGRFNLRPAVAGRVRG